MGFILVLFFSASGFRLCASASCPTMFVRHSGCQWIRHDGNGTVTGSCALRCGVRVGVLPSRSGCFCACLDCAVMIRRFSLSLRVSPCAVRRSWGVDTYTLLKSKQEVRHGCSILQPVARRTKRFLSNRRTGRLAPCPSSKSQLIGLGSSPSWPG